MKARNIFLTFILAASLGLSGVTPAFAADVEQAENVAAEMAEQEETSQKAEEETVPLQEEESEELPEQKSVSEESTDDHSEEIVTEDPQEETGNQSYEPDVNAADEEQEESQYEEETDTDETMSEISSAPVYSAGVREKSARRRKLGSVISNHVEELLEVPVLSTDVEKASDGCILVGIRGKYISDATAALARINEIRMEACKEGVRDPRTGKPLSMDDYVPIKWSSDLEYIARIRAAESSITMDHQRTNGNDAFDIHSKNGLYSSGEVLAWCWEDDAVMGIELWYGEKKDWVKGTQGAVTGHYTQMIDPDNRYVGLGTFCSDQTMFYNTTAGEFSGRTGLNESRMSAVPLCIQTVEMNVDFLNDDYTLFGDLENKVWDACAHLATVGTYYTVAGGMIILDEIEWSSEHEDIVSVDENGTTYSNGCGKTTLHFTVPATGFSGDIPFTVNHTPEKTSSVEPTCTQNGLSEGKRCSVCGEILEGQKTIPMTGHHFGQWSVLKEATDDEPGICEHVCSGCGFKEQKEFTEGYTITYVLNGGDNNEANPSMYIKGDKISLQSPRKIGATFGGWYSDKKYKKKVTSVSGGNKTVYAKWTMNKYNIAFNGNGATSGKMKKQTGIGYTTTKTLAANAFKKKGYSFTGWNTSKDGSGDSYANKAKVKRLSDTNKATVTLYAQWRINDYKINYNLNGGINNETNPSTYTVNDKVVLSNPAKEHYVFAGWYSDKKFKKKVTTIAKGSTGNRTLYAKWTPIKYTIAFDKNDSGASGSMKNLNGVAWNSTKKLTANGFKKEGYSFIGWNTMPDGSGTAYSNKANVRNLAGENGTKVTLYAQWKMNTYKVTYKTNGGIMPVEARTSYNVHDDTIILEVPTREGYTFVGWYTDAKFKKKAPASIAAGSTGNRIYYAKWKKK